MTQSKRESVVFIGGPLDGDRATFMLERESIAVYFERKVGPVVMVFLDARAEIKVASVTVGVPYDTTLYHFHREEALRQVFLWEGVNATEYTL